MRSPWETILQVALRTPSPHNTQPWRVKIREELRATLFMERARMLPDEDITGQFLRCAMGLFVETLRHAAANAGFLLHVKLEAATSAPLMPFAELELEKGSLPSPFSEELLISRRTSRLPSNGVPIAPATTAELKALAIESGQRYEQIDDLARIEAIIRENIRAVFHDLNVRAYHDEIARWFRYSDKEARLKNDGLDYRCMSVPPAQLKLMRSLPQVMRWPLVRNLVEWKYRAQIGRVTQLGIIAGPFFDDDASVRAGAFLMRFWLELARTQIYIHPFGNLVTNTEAAARVRELTGIDDIWLVFRIGHTAVPPRSYRRSLEQVLIHD
jgi:hypothetical protein